MGVLPSPSASQIEYTSEIVRLLERATAPLHRLGGVGRLLPNPDLLIAPYVRLEAPEPEQSILFD